MDITIQFKPAFESLTKNQLLELLFAAKNLLCDFEGEHVDQNSFCQQLTMGLKVDSFQVLLSPVYQCQQRQDHGT